MSIESRSRMISFRITSQEYDRFHQVCFEQGIPSISELARVAINFLLDQSPRAPREALESRVLDLEGRVQHLARELRKLNPASPLLPAEPIRLLASSAAAVPE